MENLSLSEYQERHQNNPQRNRPNIDPKLGAGIIAVVLVAISFVGGMQYQKSKTPSTTQTAAASQAGGQRLSGMGTGGRFGGGNRTVGTVSAVSDSSITITGRSGTAETYTITSSTTVTNSGQSGSISDIQSGDRVFLTLAGTGSKTVTAIDLNPNFGGQGGTGQQGASSSSDNSTDSSPDTCSI